jgi:hypothetical protein
MLRQVGISVALLPGAEFFLQLPELAIIRAHAQIVDMVHHDRDEPAHHCKDRARLQNSEKQFR